MRAGIAFGSNLGESLQVLRQARAVVQASAVVGPPCVASRVYRTSPVDCPEGSGPFLNAVLEVELTGSAAALLRDLLQCERCLGRTERGERNAPRVIDLDLLYAGDLQMEEEGLVLPHPRMTERRFVLEPLAEIRPKLVLPGQTKSVAELARELGGDETAEALDVLW